MKWLKSLFLLGVLVAIGCSQTPSSSEAPDAAVEEVDESAEAEAAAIATEQ
mgnify:CR=1 FL=1